MLLRKLLAVFLLKGASLLLVYAAAAYISRMSGAGGMGEFGLYLSVSALLSMLCCYGFPYGALKISGAEGSDRNDGRLLKPYFSMLGLSLGTSLLAVIVLWFCSDLLAQHFIKGEEGPAIFRLCALAILPTTLLEISAEMLRGANQSRLYMFLKEVFIWLILVVMMAWQLKGEMTSAVEPVTWHLAGLSTASVIAFIGVLVVFRSRSGEEPAPEEEVQDLKLPQLLKISLPMLVSKGLQTHSQYLIIVILGALTSQVEVGIYLIATRIASLATHVAYSMNVFIAPRIARLYETDDEHAFRTMVRDSVRMTFWFSIPLILLLAYFSKPFLRLFGPEFPDGVWVLIILLVANAIDSVCGPVGYLLNMTGHERHFSRVMIISTVGLVVLLFILIPFLYLEGAALAAMLYVLCWNLLSLRAIRQNLDFSPAYLPFMPRRPIERGWGKN